MAIHLSLLRWLLRQTLPVTLIALPVATLYVLFAREPLGWQDPWAAMFVLAHSIAITSCLGRFRSSGFTFLYTRGYSRDQLWAYTMLATVASVLFVWLSAALIVWTPLRGLIQDKLFVSPYFPVMAIREASVPWSWLAGYAILLPMFHYVWIRRAQPTKGGNGAVLLAVGVVIVMSTLMTFRWHRQWFIVLLWITSMIVVVTTLIAGRTLHKSMEVHE